MEDCCVKRHDLLARELCNDGIPSRLSVRTNLSVVSSDCRTIKNAALNRAPTIAKQVYREHH